MALFGVAFWGLAAAGFGLVMAFAGLTRPGERRHLIFVGAVAYALVSAGAATMVDSLWVNLLAPGGLLLTGYWLSGLLFHSPQSWLEAWLVRTDRALGADGWRRRLPPAVAELLEASYAAVYLIVGGGAIFAATAGTDAVTHYWDLVLTAALASYAPLPWLRSRPPRVLEAMGAPKGNGVRRLNMAILDRASVQANTLPSGHVSGTVAAALATMVLNPAAGWMLMAVAAFIAVAAVAGRYHYAVDCVAGAVLAVLVYVVV